MTMLFRIAALLVLCTAGSTLAFPPLGGVTKHVYTIHGYLDAAPKGVAVLDRLDVTASDGKARVLVIAKYTKPGDVPPFDGRISRDPNRNFSVMGGREEVSRLMSAATGAEVVGTFVVYEGSPASLMITELARPAKAAGSAG